MNNIEIGSKEWKELRRTKVTSTDAASILGVGYLTPYQLWLRKITGDEEKDNPAMKRGRDLEATARGIFEQDFETSVKPAVLFHDKHDFLMATVDGINSRRGDLVEIKCPGIKNHEIALDGKIPEAYRAQMQHHMMVSGMRECVYMSYCPDHSKPVQYIDVVEDKAFIEQMFDKEKSFYDNMVKMIPPELTDKDCIEVFDPEYLKAAQDWLEASAMVKSWEFKEECAKNVLKRFAKEHNVIGANVRVSSHLRNGAIDYKAIPALKGIDIERYRKSPTRVFTVSVV